MATWVLLISCMLGVGFLATRLSSLLRIPHSVFLVLLGIVVGQFSRSLFPPEVWRLFPDVVLYVLLPPLVFDSAYHMDYQALRRDRWPLLALSVFGLSLSCAIIGAGLHWLTAMPWAVGFLFGALISATDPVSVVALFRELGVRARLSTLVEGESLLNDGTAIVLFRVILGVITAGQLRSDWFGMACLKFLGVALGGVGVGLALILIASLLLRFTSNSPGPAQVGLTVTAAYTSFIVADSWLGVSGVISTLTVGLYLGNRARLALNSEALQGMHMTWEFFALSANTLVFLAVGLSVNADILIHAGPYLLVTIVLVYLARTLSVSLSLWGVRALRLSDPVRRADQLVLIWGGLRGGLALALALILPDSLPEKSLFLAMATAVVLATMLGNATTMGWLVARLRLDRLTPQEELVRSRSFSQALAELFVVLDRTAERGGLSGQLVDELRSRSAKLSRPRELCDPVPFAVSQMLAGEQHYYHERFEAGTISTLAYLYLCRSVSARRHLLDSDLMSALAGYAFSFEHHQTVADLWWGHHHDRVTDLELNMEVLLHLHIGLEAAPDETFPLVQELRQNWTDAARRQLDDLQLAHPDIVTAVQSTYLAHTLNASVRRSLDELLSTEVINSTIFARACSDLQKFQAELLEASGRLLRLSYREILQRVPLFAALPEPMVTQIESWSKRRSLAAGEVLFEEGQQGDSFFVLLNGILEAQGGARIFAGSFFGELSLLYRVPRSVTVTAVLDCELVEIEKLLFEQVLTLSPEFRRNVETVGAERAARFGLEPR
jgi:CPA1 family monovalent cation:H+ antiporter